MPNFLVEVYLLFFWGGYTLHMVRLVVSLIGREAVNGYKIGLIPEIDFCRL